MNQLTDTSYGLSGTRFEFVARSWDPISGKSVGTVLKASRGSDGVRRLHGIASSTTRDLHGDVIRQTAIEDMTQSANNNLTIFLNHSYNVPEDVGGSVTKAINKTRGVDQDGNPNTDLEFDIVINETNPRAISTWEAIDAGTKLGLSIGAMIPDGGATRQKDGTWVIDHLELLETSLVGVPANPRSWVDYAVKALDPERFTAQEAARKAAKTVPLETPTLTLDGDMYRIEGRLSDVKVASNGTTITVGEDGPENVDILDAGCPSCGGSKNSPKGDCSNDYHDSDDGSASDRGVEPVVNKEDEPNLSDDVTPSVQEAKVRVIEIDTDDGGSESPPADSQEAPPSEPEGEDAVLDETAPGDDAMLGDTVSQSLLPVMTNSTNELLKALNKEHRLRKEAEAARDEAERQRDLLTQGTAEILNKLADTPLVRRTAVTKAQQEFHAKYASIYDEEFLSFLEKRNE